MELYTGEPSVPCSSSKQFLHFVRGILCSTGSTSNVRLKATLRHYGLYAAGQCARREACVCSCLRTSNHPVCVVALSVRRCAMVATGACEQRPPSATEESP